MSGRDAEGVVFSDIQIAMPFPWELLLPHQGRAIRNHGATVQELAAFGKLTAGAVLAIVEERPWQPVDPTFAVLRLARHLALAAQLRRENNA